jgi:hypothetical protein
MSTIQSGVSVQELARTLMQTFEANRHANARHTADDFSTFLGRLLTGVTATDSAANAVSTASTASTTSPAAITTPDLRFDGLDLSMTNLPANDPLKSGK